jgi:DNA-directed RNA polymerase subunit beta'
MPTESAKTRDITGGLPRVAELFEARRPKDCAVIAEMDGRVEFGRDYKNKRRIKITPEDGGDAVEFLIPKGKHIAVHDGDVIRKGEYIIDGNPDSHDILRIQGIEALADSWSTRSESMEPKACRQRQAHRDHRAPDAQKVEIMEPATPACKGDHLARQGGENNKAEARGGRRLSPSRSCSASPRPRCRPAASSRRPPSRRPPACSPRPRSRARTTPWKG